MSPDEHIQSSKLIDQVRYGYPDKRRAAPVVLFASPSYRHLKKEYASVQVGDVHLDFMKPGSEPGGNGRRHRIPSECAYCR